MARLLVRVGWFREDRRYAGGVNIRFGAAEMGFDGRIGLRLQAGAQVRLEMRLLLGRLPLVGIPLGVEVRFGGATAGRCGAEIRLGFGLCGETSVEVRLVVVEPDRFARGSPRPGSLPATGA
jgi:hypothetical protein